ncbi:MAG TPA: ABC transporter ATP-binding protein [Solirubrobacteraceae bacterium]|jgi:peptide/nickel transport system ATP-binding protein|nr:ABC transporter ATP-binding protein [Solirubrobacteraceae bacterium]
MSARAPILEVDDLAVTFATGREDVEAVRGVSFCVAPGERLGIVGESGSGKTVSALAITGLLAPTARATGRVRFAGRDVGGPRSRERRGLRGRHVGTILQDPLTSLNPSMTIGAQITEALREHLHLDRAAARRRAIELLGDVGITDPARTVDEYPHRLSGGMRQRAMIAIALSCEPEIVVADEPTTALDVTIQAQIVELLVRLCDERDTALLLITHDLGILAGVAHRILVMYGGRIVEEAPVDDLFYRPAHPYTCALLASIPRSDRAERPAGIRGEPATGVAPPAGCSFERRCPRAQARCRTDDPILDAVGDDTHRCACHYAGAAEPPTIVAGELR